MIPRKTTKMPGRSRRLAEGIREAEGYKREEALAAGFTAITYISNCYKTSAGITHLHINLSFMFHYFKICSVHRYAEKQEGKSDKTSE